MRIHHALAAACLLSLLAANPVFGDDTRFDGHFWRNSDARTRQLFVYSFMNGVIQGQDRVARRLMLHSREGEFRPECHKAVSKNANRLEAELTKLDRRGFIDALDAFYDLPPNRELDLKWAVLVVMQQLKGTSPSDIERYIDKLKRPPQ